MALEAYYSDSEIDTKEDTELEVVSDNENEDEDEEESIFNPKNFNGVSVRSLESVIVSLAAKLDIRGRMKIFTVRRLRKFILDTLHEQEVACVMFMSKNMCAKNADIPWLHKLSEQAQKHARQWQKHHIPSPVIDACIKRMYKTKNITDAMIETANDGEDMKYYSPYYRVFQAGWGERIKEKRSRFFECTHDKDPALLSETNLRKFFPEAAEWFDKNVTEEERRDREIPSSLQELFLLASAADTLDLEAKNISENDKEKHRTVCFWCSLNHYLDLVAISVEVPDEQWEEIAKNIREQLAEILVLSEQIAKRQEEEKSSQPMSKETGELLKSVITSVLEQLRVFLVQKQKDLFMPFCYHFIAPQMRSAFKTLKFFTKGIRTLSNIITEKRRVELHIEANESDKNASNDLLNQIEDGLKGFAKILHLLSASNGNPDHADELVKQIGEQLQVILLIGKSEPDNTQPDTNNQAVVLSSSSS